MIDMPEPTRVEFSTLGRPVQHWADVHFETTYLRDQALSALFRMANEQPGAERQARYRQHYQEHTSAPSNATHIRMTGSLATAMVRVAQARGYPCEAALPALD